MSIERLYIGSPITGLRRWLALVLCISGLAHSAPTRTLSESFLLGTADLDTPVQTHEFSPAEVTAAPRMSVTGKLRFSPVPAYGHFNALHDIYGLVRDSASPVRQMPAFDVDLIQVDTDLVPVNRGTPVHGNTAWDIVFEPGKIWADDRDHEYARAVLVFTLLEKNANCTHNGMLTFLIDGRGKTSRAVYQIASETCAYLQFDLWGVADVSFIESAFNDTLTVESSYRAELAARVPVEPLSNLAKFGIDPDRLLVTDKQSVTAYGLLAFGRHFVGACQTRYGEFPYCDVLTLPSFSLAKSLVAGLAYQRLSKVYSDFPGSRVRDYVPECQDLNLWNDVTISNLLDMTTGGFDSAVNHADEAAEKMSALFLAETHSEKITFSCNAYSRRVPPGSVWVYHTSDTYIAGALMDSFLRSRTHSKSDVFRDLIVEPIFKPLMLSPTTWNTRRTQGLPAQPFYGWGLILHRDDIVRIASFLMNSNGKLNGVELLDQRELNTILQRAPSRRGFSAGSDALTYLKGFWGIRLTNQKNCAAWASFMSGYGGITVAMLPNGVVYYTFTDGNDFRWKDAALETEKLAPFCTGNSR